MQTRQKTLRQHLKDNHRQKIVVLESESGWTIQLPDVWIAKIRPIQLKFVQRVERLLVYKSDSPFYMKFDESDARFLARVDPGSKTIWIASHEAYYEGLYKVVLAELEADFPGDESIRQSARIAREFHARFNQTLPYVEDLDEAIAATSDLSSYRTINSNTMERAGTMLRETLAPGMRRTRSSLKERWMQAALAALGRKPELRCELLQFVVLLPSLDFDRQGTEVKKHLLETIDNLHAAGVEEFRARVALSLYHSALVLIRFFVRVFPARLIGVIVRTGIRFTGRTFIAGESFSKSEKAFRSIEQKGKTFTIDQLGELVMTEPEAEAYLDRILDTIDYLGGRGLSSKKNKAGLPAAHVSIKVSALSSFCSGQDPDESYNRIAPRLKRILERAHSKFVFINLDAEHYPSRDLIPGILFRLLEDQPTLRSKTPLVGIVVQAYLKDALGHLRFVAEAARQLGIRLPIRLVKGAYLDEEAATFAAGQSDIPQFQEKTLTDANFRFLMNEILSEPALQLTIASHNPGDHCYAISLRELYYPHAPVIEHQCLYRTFDSLSSTLARLGLPVREYVPVGNILIGMSYLVRRLLENSSQSGFLSMARMDPMKFRIADSIGDYLSGNSDERPCSSSTVATEVRFLPANHVELFRSQIRRDFLDQNSWLDSATELSHFDGERFSAWVERDPEKEEWFQSGRLRALIMIRLAERLHCSRLAVAHEIVFESNKTPGEALADVNEAIDFICYYACEQLKFEQNESSSAFIARGVFAVICPWNFPLAIPCGMATAALLTGNRVALKPAEQTPMIGEIFARLAREAGVPGSALFMAQGDGTAGETILRNPRTTDVVFTGSYDVGTLIMSQMRSRKNPETGNLARVITEMGGKNAIIITASADFDEAIAGVLYAALAHGGQKCSACSRLLMDQRIARQFLTRLTAAMRDVPVGEGLSFTTLVNPLISSTEKNRVRQYVQDAIQECKSFGGQVLIDRSEDFTQPALVGPVLIELPAQRFRNPESTAAREAFAPIVHATTFQDMGEALELLNSTDYALTAGLYSQSSVDVSNFLKFAHAGNLYVNRPNTGARVAIEPFGGFFMSGTGPKAGGPGYLPAFRSTQPRKEMIQTIQPELNSSLPSVNLSSGLTQRVALMNRDEWLTLPAELGEFENFEATPGHTFVRDWQKSFLSKFDVLSSGVSHFNVPGQINFDSIHLIKKNVAIFSNREELTLATGLRILAGLFLGAEIHLFSPGQSIDLRDKHIQKPDRFYRHRFGRADILKITEQNSWSHIFLDGDHEFLTFGIDGILSCAHPFWHLFSMTTSGDGIDLNPETIIKELTFTRSIAIHSLRYGTDLKMRFAL